MKRIIGLLLTISVSIMLGEDNRKLGRVQQFTPSNHDHWIQMRKAARTGELPAFLKESRKLNQEKMRTKKAEESNRQLNNAISDSELVGRWEETSNSEEMILTVGSDQEIPNSLHVFGLEESDGAITVETSSGTIEATYLPTALVPMVANISIDGLFEGEWDYPIVELSWLYMDNMDDYVSHPDSIFVAILNDSVSYSYGVTGGEDMENVTVFAGDILYEEEPEWDSPRIRIVHGITITDPISLQVIDLMENSTTVTIAGDIEHGTISLMAGFEYPIENPFEWLWEEDEEYDDYYIEKFYVEFLSDNTGLFIDYKEDLEYSETYIDSSAFVWSTWDDTLAITEKHMDWDEDKEEEMVITETIDLVYEIEDSVLSISAELDFCKDEFEDPLSPYACGDSLRYLGIYGLNDVESLIISFTATHDFDGESGSRTELVFDQIFPGDESVIEITSDNAWTDSLLFAWESADHIYGGGDITYYSEFTGDLGNIFLMPVKLTDNVWKIPYHHIKKYMDDANIAKATGTWDIWSTDGASNIWSANGPFTLAIDASALSVENGDILPDQFELHANFPNPFNPTTSINYDLPENASVSLMIYDIMGREIKHLVNEAQNAGFKAIMWDGTNNFGQQVGTGMYLYQIKAGSFTQTRKMLLMK